MLWCIVISERPETHQTYHQGKTGDYIWYIKYAEEIILGVGAAGDQAYACIAHDVKKNNLNMKN